MKFASDCKIGALLLTVEFVSDSKIGALLSEQHFSKRDMLTLDRTLACSGDFVKKSIFCSLWLPKMEQKVIG